MYVVVIRSEPSFYKLSHFFNLKLYFIKLYSVKDTVEQSKRQGIRHT